TRPAWARPAAPRKTHAKAQGGHTPPELFGATALGFPVAGPPRQKICAWGALLGQLFIATVAVVADGRRGDEQRRRLTELGQSGNESPRRVHATAAQQVLVRFVPAASSDGSPSQV